MRWLVHATVSCSYHITVASEIAVDDKRSGFTASTNDALRADKGTDVELTMMVSSRLEGRVVACFRWPHSEWPRSVRLGSRGLGHSFHYLL
jgi:hypothetical protein